MPGVKTTTEDDKFIFVIKVLLKKNCPKRKCKESNMPYAETSEVNNNEPITFVLLAGK